MSAVDLVITDLDGTLWPHEGHIPDAVLSAWSAVERAGVPILVATGRRAKSARVPLAAFGLTPPAVLLDGALGIDLATGTRFHERSIDPTVAAAILAAFRSCGLSPVVYGDGVVHDIFIDDACSTNPAQIALYGPDATHADLEAAVVSENVLAFGLVGAPWEPCEALVAKVLGAGIAEARLNPSFDYGGCSLTVVGETCTKWDGVLAYCDRTGIDPTRTLAIGDGSNDVELLRNAGIACSLEGSSVSALAVADHIFAPVNSGGWAELLALL